MIVKLTYAERDTILAALRRWQSYPAAREADSIATGGGKHGPLDNAEIERICKRMTKMERKRDARLFRQSDNGMHERKAAEGVEQQPCSRTQQHPNTPAAHTLLAKQQNVAGRTREKNPRVRRISGL